MPENVVRQLLPFGVDPPVRLQGEAPVVFCPQAFVGIPAGKAPALPDGLRRRHGHVAPGPEGGGNVAAAPAIVVQGHQADPAGVEHRGLGMYPGEIEGLRQLRVGVPAAEEVALPVRLRRHRHRLPLPHREGIIERRAQDGLPLGVGGPVRQEDGVGGQDEELPRLLPHHIHGGDVELPPAQGLLSEEGQLHAVEDREAAPQGGAAPPALQGEAPVAGDRQVPEGEQAALPSGDAVLPAEPEDQVSLGVESGAPEIPGEHGIPEGQGPGFGIVFGRTRQSGQAAAPRRLQAAHPETGGPDRQGRGIQRQQHQHRQQQNTEEIAEKLHSIRPFHRGEKTGDGSPSFPGSGVEQTDYSISGLRPQEIPLFPGPGKACQGPPGRDQCGFRGIWMHGQ